MATLLSALETQTRRHLQEPTARFWSSAELIDIAILGCHDLWRAINDLFKAYFITIDITNVSLAASSNTLTGVPADLFRVVSIEPRVLGENNPNAGLIFKPREYTHPDFVRARAYGAVEPKNNIIFYEVMSAGAPVAAPTIRVAPQVSSAVDLTLVYNHVLGTLTAESANPIPGQSDNALIAWMVAYARAKAREDQAPDPEWIAVYGTEKQNLLRQLTPRSIQEPETVVGMFEGDDYAGSW